MKIYPNKFNIEIKNEINNSFDIPLAYVDTTTASYDITTTINEEFKSSSKQELLPYNVVNNNICLFDKFEQQIPYDKMVNDFIKDNEKGYVYVPKNESIRFIPKKYEYKLKGKKKIKYQSNMIYNINAIVYNNLSYANNLMQIFGDAASRDLAPNNILINNGDLSLKKITSNELINPDITFFLLKNMETIIEEEEKEYQFNINDLIDNLESNLFFIIKDDNAIKNTDKYDNEKINLLYSEKNISFNTANPNIYTDAKIDTKYFFNIPKNTDKKIYHKIFNNSNTSPIIIEENIDKTFLIYASENIFNNLKENYKIIYETLAYVLFNSYISSDYITDWITDTIPDYIVKNNKLIKKNKFTSDLNIAELLNLNIEDIEKIKVIIDSEKYPYVEYVELYNNYLIFKKNKGLNNIYADPKEKPLNWISIYINDEIFFYKDFVYKINNKIEDCVNIQNLNNEIIIDLKPFRHSDSGIFIKYQQEPIIIQLIEVINNIEYKIQNEVYYLICKNNDSVSRYEVVKKKDYYSNDIILLTINVTQDTKKIEKNIFDMRQRGGGLPLSEEDNFDCFDIGHINGRPYRKASSMIITLPKHLEPYKDRIMAVIQKYKLIDDYPIIIFKE